jgi:putative lipase involved disintegration of autophagic bodies
MKLDQLDMWEWETIIKAYVNTIEITACKLRNSEKIEKFEKYFPELVEIVDRIKHLLLNKPTEEEI